VGKSIRCFIPGPLRHRRRGEIDKIRPPKEKGINVSTFIEDGSIDARFASAALLTTFPWPVWRPAMGRAWPVGMVVPEIALWLAALPVCFAAAALWLGRRGPHPRRAVGSPGWRSALCAAGVILLCKPAGQA
jgi:hypothetical protein